MLYLCLNTIIYAFAIILQLKHNTAFTLSRPVETSEISRTRDDKLNAHVTAWACLSASKASEDPYRDRQCPTLIFCPYVKSIRNIAYIDSSLFHGCCFFRHINHTFYLPNATSSGRCIVL